ncbi:MAG TPA: GTPase ObgE [Spirochaetia bacterium]|nr:GTPase ObgE [Spirochaetia bacterium]
MFYDHVKIFVSSGKGGDGLASFRREKYVPRGGPWGGDGGRGGHVILRADAQLATLADFRYRRHYRAEKGGAGGSKSRTGRSSEDLVVRVPAGTVVRSAETGEVLADLVEDGQSVIVARGGRGGRGNIHFATPTNRAPGMAEKGEPGQEFTLELELKLLADAGLVGLPNAGKSTLLSRLSAARPKVGDYPFTTLEPSLGVVRVEEGLSFVLADLPGLVEGAHTGAGLGLQFLRHIERTRLLVHVVDVSDQLGRDPVEEVVLIEREMALYGHGLAKRPVLMAANKVDLPGAAENMARLADRYADREIFPVSGLTGAGLEELKRGIARALQSAPLPEMEAAGPVRYRFEPRFTVDREEDGFRVRGREVEKHLAMTSLDNEEAVARFQRIMRLMGVEEALRQKGAAEGSRVFIGDSEFNFFES